MVFRPEYFGPNNEGGGILNIYAELPEWLENVDVEFAILEIDANIQGMKNPPVAQVLHASLDPSVTPEFRRFYVEFQDDATIEDIFTATRIVIDSLKRFRRSEKR